MTRVRLWHRLLVLPLLAAALGARPAWQISSESREAAYRANNLGVARLEQFEYASAAEAFRQALLRDNIAAARFNLALALFYANDTEAASREARAAVEQLPELPHPQYLLGLIARLQNEPDTAIAAFTRVLARDPADVGAQVNLGQVHLQQQRFAEAAALFRKALAAEPYNVTAAYNLATALTRAGAADEAKLATARFHELRDSGYGVTYAQRYLDQGKYAEAIVTTGAEAELVDRRVPAARFTDATPPPFTAPARVQLQSGPVASQAEALSVAGAVTLFDKDGDGDLDLLDTSASGLRLFENDAGKFLDRTRAAGLALPDGGTAVATVAGDYDNDRQADLFVVRHGGNRLLRQVRGTFQDVTSAASLPVYPHLARSAAFVDVDHDGDLDLFVAAYTDGSPNQLLRNNGNGTFADVTDAARVGATGGRGIAVVPTDVDNRRDIDLMILRRGQSPVLLQNARDGSFRDATREAGFPPAASYSTTSAGDVNKDGYPDFFFGTSDGPGTFLLSDGHRRFVSRPAPASGHAVASQLLDYDNDGLLDLLIVFDRRAQLWRNLGTGWSDVSDSAGLAGLKPASDSFQSVAAGDLDGDGDTDVVVRQTGGGLRFWRNDGGNTNRSVSVRLEGTTSNRMGVGAKIDLRAGSLQQRLETSSATPAVAPAGLLFGIGTRRAADVVRVLWPSGTLQAETTPSDPPAHSAMTVTELDRKPSSCPYLYTWNGRAFEFVTDFMGGGELGYWVAPGTWNQPDPDEYVRIRGDQLVPRNGRYELRVTNELEEALFVDRLQLVAIDHPGDVEVYPNEGLVGPPFRPFGVTATRHARAVHVRDDHGHDVTDRLRHIDRTYADDFALSAIRGYAEPHALTIDLGVNAERAVLLMTGWTDYAFSSDNVAAHQSGVALTPPALQVQEAGGTWRSVIENIGIPVGRPQTVVVDLRGKVPAHHRRVRIVTNMRIYWDQILVDASGGQFPTTLTRLEPVTADLRWRGFSAELTPDGHEPFGYDYSRVSATSPWKLMIGRYTREGNVRPLLTRSDDMFVVSRPGDEIAVAFDAEALPRVQQGMARTFLLYADGYSKEMNIRSASPDTVDPLPFHAMSGYPYGPSETYPQTDAHRRYLSEYNTRLVRRPMASVPLGHGEPTLPGRPR